MKTWIFNCLFLITLIPVLSHAQSRDSVFYKHKISLGLSEMVRVLFQEDEYAFDLRYHYFLSEKTALRSGFMTRTLQDDDAGYNRTSVLLGHQQAMRRYNKWNLYWGNDLVFNYNEQKNSQTVLRRGDLMAFIGIEYLIGKHFSISTEPTLIFSYFARTDFATGIPSKRQENYTGINVGRLGFMHLHFYF